MSGSRSQGFTIDEFPILPRGDELEVACQISYSQLRQWFLWLLDRGSTAYHISGALRLEGALDVFALRASFAALVERHEALRTVFRVDADGRVTAYSRRYADRARLIDLGDLVDTERTRACASRRRRSAMSPSISTQGPLLRVALIRTGPEEHVPGGGVHHIVSDGWSMQIIVEEFVAQYRARLRGEEPALEPLPIEYADYAAWQRTWLEAGEKDRQLAYWREQLGDAHPVLQLPTDHPRKAEGTLSRSAPCHCGAGAAGRRSAASRPGGRSDLVHGVAGEPPALLHRYAGERDISRRSADRQIDIGRRPRASWVP